MIKRYKVALISEGKRQKRFALSSTFVSQLEGAFQRIQRIRVEETVGTRRGEYRKSRPIAKKHLLRNVIAVPFFRLRIGRFVLPVIRRDRKVTIPKHVVEAYKINQRKEPYVYVTVETTGESSKIATHYVRSGRNTVSSQQCYGFNPEESVFPDRLFEKCRLFVTRKYNEHLEMLRSGKKFHTNYYVRLFFIANEKGSREKQYFGTTLPTRGVIENNQPTLQQTLSELEAEFWRMVVALDNYDDYDWWAMVGICYYTTDVYVKGRPSVITKRTRFAVKNLFKKGVSKSGKKGG